MRKSMEMAGSTFETDAEIVEEVRAVETVPLLTTTEKTCIRAVIIWGLFVIPLAFGGARETWFLPFYVALFTLTTYLVLKRRALVSVMLSSQRPLTRATIVTFSFLITYATVQLIVLNLFQREHPVLGMRSEAVNMLSQVRATRDLLAFLCAFILARMLFESSVRMSRNVTRKVIWAGFFIAFIGLSHWFADNGRLFWTFEPNYVFTSPRARWPFVNANHFGDYLVLAFFPLLAMLVNLYHVFVEYHENRGRRRLNSIANMVSSEPFHRRIVKPLVLNIPFLAIALAIIASLSRGAWLGVAVGLTVFFIFGAMRRRAEGALQDAERKEKILHFPGGESANLSSDRKHRRRRKKNRDDGHTIEKILSNLPRIGRPLLLVSAVVFILFFLNEQGRDLLAGRIEYGLMYSKDDTRWTLYSDSVKLLKESPLFGIGLGTWNDRYPQIASPEMGGLNAGYMHCDPFQFIVEMGLVGSLPLLALVGYLLAGVTKSIVSHPYHEGAVLLSGKVSGIIALIVASSLEFPFRMPAICFALAVMCALSLASAERSRDEHKNMTRADSR